MMPQFLKLAPPAIALLLAAPAGVNATTNPSAKVNLAELGWLTAECHEKLGRHSFLVSISSDDLDGVRQITDATLGGKLQEAIQGEAEDLTKPTVGLATIKGNDLKLLLRYDNGLMWPDVVTLQLRYKGDRYVGSARVRGDEGLYLDEKGTEFECRIGNNQVPNLQTPGFKPELLGFKSEW